jgi:hypothetical protein
MKQLFPGVIFLLLFLLSIGFSKDYKGAEYRTKDAFTYGRFEARYKPPRGDGFLASFFTYHEIESSKEWNEIDYEILGRYDHDVQVTSIGPGQKVRNSHQWVPFRPWEDFHTYVFEWTPDYIAWIIDDTEVYRQTQAHIAEFKHEQKIMMNIWPPSWDGWVGKLDQRSLPVFAYYDWVSYAAYTPGQGNTGTGNNFTLLWKDDFDGWDENRWEKGTHTFSGNNCDFMAENAVFNDGKLILCLTKESPLGYVDFSAPAVLGTRTYPNKIFVRFSEDVNAASAQKLSNYVLSGIKISEAKLTGDLRLVELTIADLDPAKTYDLIVMGIEDKSPIRNRMTGQVVRLTLSTPLTLPVKINIGGPAFRDYLPDQVWTPELEYGHQDGYADTWPASIEIQNTDEDSLYYTDLHELVTYKVRVTNGTYRVTLKMAENEFTEPEKRIFDIVVEGRRVETALDLVAKVGARTAYTRAVEDVVVDDGILDLHFTNLWNFTLLNGLVIESTGSNSIKSSSAVPGHFFLAQNYPNPFNASTTINYYLADAGHLTLQIYNIQGQQVAQLVDEFQNAGTYQQQWKWDSSSGVYFCKLDFTNPIQHFTDIKKMILLR